ncbi:MAG: hypothetical protein IPK96_21955 [Flammeovirgaceae bacterium]|nr:hypothetical protein [Flammeovirgaceae bacterium]
MMKKIRAAMGKADDDQVLTGMIEWDDAYFSTSTPKRLRKKLKRGKGSQKKVESDCNGRIISIRD